MPENKLVIRRLPPTMSEDDFLKLVSPLPSHDYFCFMEANSGLLPYSYSRAYINFLDSMDMSLFRERFDNYIFLDKDGHEYPAVVEQSLWHKSSKSGPFYCGDSRASGESPLSPSSKRGSQAGEAPDGCSRIEQDSDFLEFISKMKAKREEPQQSPIQVLETNLDQLTNSSKTGAQSSRDRGRTVTPLIGFVNQKRGQRSNRRSK